MHRDGYQAFSSVALDLYDKWDYVVEPHVTMVLHPTNSVAGASYSWQLTNAETGETLDDLEYTQEGHSLSVVFPAVSSSAAAPAPVLAPDVDLFIDLASSLALCFVQANDLWHVRLSEASPETSEVMSSLAVVVRERSSSGVHWRSGHQGGLRT